jgi:hypothetical protein
MSAIINLPSQTTQITDVVAQIVDGNTSVYSFLLANYLRLFNLVWYNPNFTPAQIVSAFGTNAQLLFEVSISMGTLLHTVNPSYIPPSMPSGYTYTVNADGSITVIPPSQ